MEEVVGRLVQGVLFGERNVGDPVEGSHAIAITRGIVSAVKTSIEISLRHGRNVLALILDDMWSGVAIYVAKLPGSVDVYLCTVALGMVKSCSGEDILESWPERPLKVEVLVVG